MPLFRPFIILLFLEFSLSLFVTPVFADNKKGSKSAGRSAIAKDMSATFEGLFTARRLPAPIVGRVGLSVHKPFSKVGALKLLLPGNYYHVATDFSDTADYISWYCPSCTPHTFANWPEEQPAEDFPRLSIVTEPCDTLMYTDDSGIKHIIFSFASHTGADIADLNVGRFFAVVMGLAWFTEKNNSWVLDDCVTGLGMYGAFQQLPRIELVKLGRNNYGCYLVNSNGGPGQVYVGDLYVFARVNGRSSIVLKEKKVSRSNTPSSDWGMELQPFTGKATAPFMPLQIELSGIYKRVTPDTVYDWTDHPVEMLEKMQARDSLYFKVNRQYIFKNGKYRKIKGTITELALDPTR